MGLIWQPRGNVLTLRMENEKGIDLFCATGDRSSVRIEINLTLFLLFVD